TNNNETGNIISGIPIISDGPIFIESWQSDDENDWGYYRFYMNSFIYKFQNYQGTGAYRFQVLYNERNPIDFNAQYFREGGDWTNETFDNSGASWEDHYHVLDSGRMFVEDTGDSNILVTLWNESQDADSNKLLIRECRFDWDPALDIRIGCTSGEAYKIVNDLGVWQFYKDVGSTNVSDKQDFVDNLYNVTIDNPPTISSLGKRQMVFGDVIDPTIIEISQNPLTPGNLDSVNITVHITDNVGVDVVLIHHNRSGSMVDYKMDLLSGNDQNGYWNYTISSSIIHQSIKYSIWTNDSSNNSVASIQYQYYVVDNEDPNMVNLYINVVNPRIADFLNITVRITDNVEVDKVLLYTNLTGVFKYFDMNLISGSTQDGYWSYNGYVPGNASGKTVVYQIWFNDTNGQTVISSQYQFTVKKATLWDWIKWLLLLLQEEGIDFIIIIIIGSVAVGGIFTSTYVVRKRQSVSKTKKKASRVKSKKNADLDSTEIRKLLQESKETAKPMTITLEDLKNTIRQPVSVIPEEILIRVGNLKNLTDEEKQLLLRDLASIGEELREEWLKEVEDLD
ncbi:MAG: hypothetical protein ACTSO9_18135, partial [Candidatus Helarchaeota archaeon]